MKRSILINLILIIGVSLFAQNTVSISGKILNQNKQKISLTVNSFDIDKMIGPGDKGYGAKKITAEAFPDSTYFINTDLIVSSFTPCILNFGTKKSQLLLCPGDSLVIDLDYWYFDSNISIEGIGGPRNAYWTNTLRLSQQKEALTSVGKSRGQGRIDKRNELKNSELEFLDSSLMRSEIDSAFYEWESKRIRYDCFDSNVRFSTYYNNRFGMTLNETEYYNSVDLKDEEALLTIQSYRSLIKNYEEIHIASGSSVSNGDMRYMMSFGDNSLSGLTKTYFLWKVVRGAINEAVDEKQKQLILDYAIEHINDKNTSTLLQNLEGKVYGGFVLGKSFSSGWANAAYILGGIFILGILFILTKNFISKKRRIVRSRNYSFIRAILGLILLIFTIFIIADSGLDEVFPYLYIISIVVFMILHNRISIRWFASSKKHLFYTISTTVLLAGFFLVIYFAYKGSYGSFSRNELYSYVLPVFIITSCVMIPYAFIYYYAGLARKHKNGWSHLLDQKIISIEAVFHVLIVSVVIIAVAANMSSAADLLSLFEVIIGLLVFYVTAYLLIINNLLKKKYVSFIIYSFLTILGFAAIVSLISGIFTYAGLSSRGIAISFFDTLEFPSFDLFIFALPAIIYAYARKLFNDREELGFSMYHQKEAEFNQLKAQVNPHFLFNSLNTVYAFALKEGNEKTAESIAKLANLMRYLIDDMEKDEIPIKKEIGYIEDYIKLQLIRSSVDHNISINIDLDEEQQSDMIAPMLMIPFVENAFKHGINPNSISEFKLKVSFVNRQFQFVLENSVDKKFEAFYKEKGFGIGIENVRKRLEYIYPDKHTLSIADTEDSFIVIMNIQLPDRQSPKS